MKYTVSCTIRYAFPEGKYTGFGRTEKSGGMERTKPKRTTMYAIKAQSKKAAESEMKDRIRRMTSVYTSDGWEFYVNEGFVVFTSDSGVSNIYADWTLEEE